LIRIETASLHQLLAATHAEGAPLHPILGVLFLTADLDRDGFIDDFTALRAVAHRCVCATVIQIRTRFGFHQFCLNAIANGLSIATEPQSPASCFGDTQTCLFEQIRVVAE
jgi:hypothetical protein